MKDHFHSVRLRESRCRGCVNCTKRCPTVAIRVHNGKAQIIESRCIDCGECIRHCLHRAKAAISDDLDVLGNYKYTVALTAPALYAQFPPAIAVEQIMVALQNVGFDEVYKVAKAAEIVTVAIDRYLAKNKYAKPVISSACPAVLRLIQVSFPELSDHVLPFDAPVEIAARIARKEAVKKTGYASEDIGIFFLTPCPAKVTAIKQPYGHGSSHINGAIALNKIHHYVMKNLPQTYIANDGDSSHVGMGWALAGGETKRVASEKQMVVSGIHNVIGVLEAVSVGMLHDIDYVECLACDGGCIGGPLTVENRFKAENNMKKRLKMSEKYSEANLKRAEQIYEQGAVKELKLLVAEPRPTPLDDELKQAYAKVELRLLEEILDSLPGFDCGACGSPNCISFAEDIIGEKASITDCIFKLRERVRNLAEEIADLANRLPPVMSRSACEDEGEEE